MRWMVPVFVTACGGGPGEPIATLDAPEGYPITGPDAAFSCAPPWCAIVEWSVERWNRATGWHATVQFDGIPVVFTASPGEDLRGRCGAVRLGYRPGTNLAASVEGPVGVVLYERPGACWDLHRSVTHEIGHVLCARVDGDCHSPEACLMRSAAGVDSCPFINSSDLDLVCERWGCPSRNPEGGITSRNPVTYPPLPAR